MNDIGKPVAGPQVELQLVVNGVTQQLRVAPFLTLAEVLRDHLHLTGTKIGCEAGDCGACTVLLSQRQVCACLVPIAQCDGETVSTVEAGAHEPLLPELQAAFARHGAAQCGICTPGMLMSALDFLNSQQRQHASAVHRGNLHSHSTASQDDPPLDVVTPSDAALRGAIETAIGGTLCRCTGYLKIVDAIADVAQSLVAPTAPDRPSALIAESAGNGLELNLPAVVGTSMVRVDAPAKLDGTELYGADTAPVDALWLRIIRSPHPHARFTLGDTTPLLAAHPDLERILTAADIPGVNGFGIYPHIKDQPVLADGLVRYRGEPVLALVGTQAAIAAVTEQQLPLIWEPLEPFVSMAEATASGAPPLHAEHPDNVLIRGRTRKGDAELAERELPVGWSAAQAEMQTAFVEHAYLEPEAGYAVRVNARADVVSDTEDRIRVFASTQAPQMDLEEIANVLGVRLDQVRVQPSACGGGFGGKLDVSVQPLLAVAAWLTGRPVRVVLNRIESMAASTKRHPARLRARAVADADGRLQGFALQGDFNTGAYASWGPTVAGRVPVHCTGPYRVENVRCDTRAIFTHAPPSGAFRGFGTPQAALARELCYDKLADALQLDRWDFRYRNAFRTGDVTPSGQQLNASCGMEECLLALRDSWHELQRDAAAFNQQQDMAGVKSPWRRGTGIACMWYGCGNTGLSNPSAMRVVLAPTGRLVFYNGAVDIGQGSSTVLLQICADAVGLPPELFDYVTGDTDLTEDAGKTSASRQTFVSGRAAQLAGTELRLRLLALLGTNGDARLQIADGCLSAHLDYTELSQPLKDLPVFEDVLGEAVIAEGKGSFDPPITPLDQDGQGQAYATYAFAAQICTVDVNVDTGVVIPKRFVAAHDVGRAVNPQLIEGQIHGGIAQGIGMALMEEYQPGTTENLHDYLIPTAGDMPSIDIVLIEAPEPLGPFGAKGVGEPALVPTPAAILSAIRDATGVVMEQVPVLPHRLHRALQQQSTSAE